MNVKILCGRIYIITIDFSSFFISRPTVAGCSPTPTSSRRLPPALPRPTPSLSNSSSNRPTLPSTTDCKATRLGPRPPYSPGSGVLSYLSPRTPATGKDLPSRSTTYRRASSPCSSASSPSDSSSRLPSSSPRSRRTSR